MYTANSINPDAAIPTKKLELALLFQFLERTYSPMPRQKKVLRRGR
jgi:hypothetical protein